jgi:hypothetical protein
MTNLVPITIDATTGQPKIPATGDTLVDADGGALGGGGGGDPPVNTTTTSTTITSNGETLICNGSSDIIITLEAAASHTDNIYTIKKWNTAPNGKVTIDGNASETIDGQTTIDLVCKYSYIMIQSDGSNWHIIDDGRIPHRAQMKRTSAQSITVGSNVRINFNTVEYDNADIADTTTNYRFDFKRDGFYILTIYSGVYTLSDNKYMQARITDAVGLRRALNINASSTTDLDLTDVYILERDAGEYFDLRVKQDHATQNTETTIYGMPRFSVEEIR